MALTTGSIGATATPADALYDVITPLLTAAGWVYVEQVSAVDAGTTAIVEVWRNAASDCYVLFEVDDTNARLRIRCSEQYNSATNKVKYPVPGNAVGTAITPTVNYAVSEAEETIFQAQGTGQKVGWINIPTSAGGYSYWLGVNSNTVLVANNSGGVAHWGVAGRLETLCPTADTTTVFLAGRGVTDNDVSWTTSASAFGNTRTSREPLTTTSAAGNFCYHMDHTWPCRGGTAVGGNPTTPHKWQTLMVVSPVVLHGLISNAYSDTRDHRAVMTGFIVFVSSTDYPSGDTITAEGVVYTLVGHAGPMNGSTSGMNHWVGVDGGIF